MGTHSRKISAMSKGEKLRLELAEVEDSLRRLMDCEARMTERARERMKRLGVKEQLALRLMRMREVVDNLGKKPGARLP